MSVPLLVFTCQEAHGAMSPMDLPEREPRAPAAIG